jgi:hypothetical protein
MGIDPLNITDGDLLTDAFAGSSAYRSIEWVDETLEKAIALVIRAALKWPA